MTLAWRLLLLACSFGFSVSALAEAQLAIIIDDIGYNQAQSERAARLPGAFTLAVLPFTPHGSATALLAHSRGKEIMLHLPMSAIDTHSLGMGGLVSGLEKAAFSQIVERDIDNIPYLKGVNNHMGSRLTQEAEPMQWLMTALRSRGLYFVDSRTSAQTKAFDIANAHQVPSLKRDVFLDDVQEAAAIEFQLKRALQFAKQRGTAVAIGHPYPTTMAVLERIPAILDKYEVQLVHASQLLTHNPKPIPLPEKPVQTEKDELPYCPVPTVPTLLEFHTIFVD